MAKRKAVYNPEADRRWNEKNREHRRYLNDRSGARRLLRKFATLEDIEELEELIEERKKYLKNSP